MKLEQSFDVAAPMERVWQALIDVERVAPCLPGATITGRNEDGSYNGTFTVKIGPTTAAYTGKLQMESADEKSHTATMQAQGSDKRGQGGATATIASRLESAEGRTRVWVATDYHITGRLARFGRGGMIEDISERLLKEFGGRLAELLEGSGDGGADQAGSPTGSGEAAQAPGVAGSGEAEEAPASEQETAEAPVVTAEGAEGAEASEASPASEPPEAPEASAAEAAEPPEASEASAAEAAEPPPTDVAEPPPAEAAAPPPPPPPPANEPLDAGSLVGSVMADRVKRNPWPLAAGAVLLVVWLRRRR